jgi:hypothetical protein
MMPKARKSKATITRMKTKAALPAPAGEEPEEEGGDEGEVDNSAIGGAAC